MEVVEVVEVMVAVMEVVEVVEVMTRNEMFGFVMVWVEVRKIG